MRYLTFITLLFISVLFTACSKTQPAIASYEKDSITINYQSVLNSNRYNNASHALTLTVYQLSSLSTLNELSSNESLVKTLMKGEKPDPSFITSHQYIIMPNEEGKITLDRFDNTKFVTIIAGFYHYNRVEDIAISTQIPTKKSYMGLGKNRYKNLDIKLKINPNSIHSNDLYYPNTDNQIITSSMLPNKGIKTQKKELNL